MTTACCGLLFLSVCSWPDKDVSISVGSHTHALINSLYLFFCCPYAFLLILLFLLPSSSSSAQFHLFLWSSSFFIVLFLSSFLFLRIQVQPDLLPGPADILRQNERLWFSNTIRLYIYIYIWVCVCIWVGVGGGVRRSDGGLNKRRRAEIY